MSEQQMDLDIEPVELAHALDTIRDARVALADILPTDFRLDALLTFVPDVRLKKRLEANAEAALAVDVTAEGGLALADARLADMQEDIRAIEECFKLPTDLANQLHKRMTGLRGDFLAPGKAAVETVGRRIYNETKRRDEVAREERRKLQEAADRAAREAAARAAEAAKAKAAPPAVVEALEQKAQTATAPPVSVGRTAPTLAGSSTVARWKARLAGTPADENPNPSIDDLTPGQQEQVRTIFRLIADGALPLAVSAGLNWSYLNKRAAAEKSTLAIPEIEAYDAGGMRAKGRR